MQVSKNFTKLESPRASVETTFKIRQSQMIPAHKKHSSSEPVMRKTRDLLNPLSLGGSQLNSESSQLLSKIVTKVNQQSPAISLPMTPKLLKPPLGSPKRVGEVKSAAGLADVVIKPRGFQKKIAAITPTMRSHINQPVFFEGRKRDLTTSLPKKQPNCAYYMEPMLDAFTRSFQTDYFQKQFRDHFYQTYQGIYFSQFMRAPDLTDIRSRRVFLPKHRDNHITIVFDLDETLIHCNENAGQPHDVLLSIQVTKTDNLQAAVNIRPGVQEMFETLVKDFEIIVFTASHQCYASKVVEHLDPQRKYVSHVLSREHCIMTSGGVFTKDLRVFGDRSLDSIVLVDNASYSYAMQVENGIPIIPYYDNKNDTQLQALTTYLQGMAGYRDVRDYNKKNLKMHLFNEPLGPLKVYEKLFGQPMDV